MYHNMEVPHVEADHALTTSKTPAQRRTKPKSQVHAAAKLPAQLNINDFEPGIYLEDHVYDIKTVAGLVEALGGEEAIASSMGIASQGVHHWVISGNIQPGWHLRLLGLLADQGRTVSPLVFGFAHDCAFEAARGLAKLMIPKRLSQLAEFRGGAHA